jgi:hypothetical protein
MTLSVGNDPIGKQSPCEVCTILGSRCYVLDEGEHAAILQEENPGMRLSGTVRTASTFASRAIFGSQPPGELLVTPTRLSCPLLNHSAASPSPPACCSTFRRENVLLSRLAWFDQHVIVSLWAVLIGWLAA